MNSETIATLANIGTVIAGIAIFVQIHKDSTISKGEFILNLENSFRDDEKIWLVAKELFKHDTKVAEFKPDMRLDIIAYLTFFETVYLLVQNGAISIKDVDNLFRRRFFKAVMNPSIQKIELVSNKVGYKNIYNLYDLWIKLLKADGIEKFAEDEVELPAYNMA